MIPDAGSSIPIRWAADKGWLEAIKRTDYDVPLSTWYILALARVGCRVVSRSLILLELVSCSSVGTGCKIM